MFHNWKSGHMDSAPMNQITMRRALLSLSDKSQLEALLTGLSAFDLELYSTGGTYAAIERWMSSHPNGGLKLVRLEDYLNYPEMPGGLVKTLHPRVHGGLLADLNNVDQVQHMHQQGMHAFDLLVVNLYPFEKTVAQNASMEACRQQIDIGGVAMLRAGAKNFPRVAVVCDPSDYRPLCDELAQLGGRLSRVTLLKLAKTAFRHVLAYDRAISQYLDSLEEEIPC